MDVSGGMKEGRAPNRKTPLLSHPVRKYISEELRISIILDKLNNELNDEFFPCNKQTLHLHVNINFMV
jgi:hypothetical protein